MAAHEKQGGRDQFVEAWRHGDTMKAAGLRRKAKIGDRLGCGDVLRSGHDDAEDRG